VLSTLVAFGLFAVYRLAGYQYAVSTMLPKPRVTAFIATTHVLIYLPIAVFAYTSGPDAAVVTAFDYLLYYIISCR
jgi:hypothetical protein